MSPEPEVLVLSTADWDRPLWTNKQHLTVQFARHLQSVTYVNSLGLRRPTLRRSDVARIGSRVASSLGATLSHGRPIPQNVVVITPRTVPFHRDRWPVWGLNSQLLRRGVSAWLNAPRSNRVLWSFSPVTYGLEDEAAAAVYHCVDLLAHFPGIDSVAIREGETRLAAKHVHAIASSQRVADHLADVGFRNIRLWENVADTELISSVSSGLERHPGRLVFVGNLTPSKVDFELLSELLRALPDATLDLAGPVAEGGGSAPSLRRLLTDARVTYHGVLPPVAMAALLGQCTVGLIPYIRSPYTEGVFPMKTYEYLAAGIAVVATDLPSLRPDRDLLIADSAKTFIAHVASVAAAPAPDVVLRRRAFAAHHSWTSRGQDAMTLLADMLPNSPDWRRPTNNDLG